MTFARMAKRIRRLLPDLVCWVLTGSASGAHP